ncbi:MAG: HAD family hydrolase [Defluviitaleaceae bacterium]|nr:HAD family hydrolase [Defluviitaleaceae bacterium]
MKDPIKMIVVDLDGTLLRDDKTISERTKSVLGRCKELDIKIVYATGRSGSFRDLQDLIDVDFLNSGIFDGRINMNGAIARVGGEIVYSSLIPCQIARPLLMACDKRGLKISSQIGSMHYTNFILEGLWSHLTNFEAVDFSKHDKDAEKIFSVLNSEEDRLFIEKHCPADCWLTVSRDGLAFVMHKDATKARAVAHLANIWGIDGSEILAFGDDLNDADMLSYVGVGVAMDNALDRVKNAADFTCLSNEEDGIAEWIMGNLL